MKKSDIDPNFNSLNKELDAFDFINLQQKDKDLNA